MTVKIDGSTGVDKVQPNSVDKEDLKWVPPFTKEYVSPEQTITAGSVTTLAHGLGVMPKSVRVTMVCKIAEQGYTVGQEMAGYIQASTAAAVNHYNFKESADATNVYARCASNGIATISTGGADVALTPANWRLIVRAWA